MATEQPQGEAASAGPELDGGSYEVIRARLLAHAKELGARADALNERRKQLFSGAELAILGNERVRTEHNCVPRDIKSVGRHLLFGFNVFIGLKSETQVSDVMSLHRFEPTADGFDLSEVPATEAGGFLADPRFVKDFQELYRYYKGTRLSYLRHLDGRLLMVFQVGESARDVKVFRFNLDPSGRATYIDNAGERENVFPPSHDFEWIPTGRDQFVRGRHPHVNILNEVFVETVGGDLTVKVENNTEDGLGIYREEVEDKNQSLDDAQIHYAKVGTLILLKVLPFREETWRYLVFNTRTRHVVRIDAIGNACIQLPEDQGIIFPGGYYLQTGDYKVFDERPEGLIFRRAIRSPNGEDVLYIFFEPNEGRYVLLPYNLVRREVATPIQCHGYSLFGDGKMIVFRSAGDEPQRVHPVQIWQTPFVSAEHAAQSKPADGSFLSKIGNAELVRGISEAYTIKRMAEAEHTSRRAFEDLIAACTRMLDGYHWLGNPETNLAQPVEDLRRSADLIVAEFEKVQALKQKAREVLAEAEAEQARRVDGVLPDSLTSVSEFMEALDGLRRHRGHLITLKEVRYVDLNRIAELERATQAHFDVLSQACVSFLLDKDALAPLTAKLGALLEAGQKAERSADLVPITSELEQTSAGLNVLAEVVGQLQVGDPVARAKILEGISEVFSHLNRVRATVQARRKEIAGREGRAEFAAQFKLLGQAIESAIGQSDTPEKCDEQLSRLMVQLEELEGRFGELDEFVAELAKKREELHEAFGAKRQQLLDERQRRAQNLFEAADRILQGLKRRAETFKTEDELNAWFASDAMVHKAQAIAEQLLSLGDSVRADELTSRLKQTKQDAARILRDKQDLFEDGASVIKLGPHRFNVNTQPLELTVVPRDGALALHLTGTDFYEPLNLEALEDTRPFWDQHLVSETKAIYRGEYLAASMLFDAEDGRTPPLPSSADAEALLPLVRSYAQERYDEGYERGVHDADAAKILAAVLALRQTAGLLRFGPVARAHAQLFWAWHKDEHARAIWHRRAVSYGRLRDHLARTSALLSLAEELTPELCAFAERVGAPCSGDEAQLAARYLVEELTREQPRFTTAQASVTHKDAFWAHLERAGTRRELEEDLRQLNGRWREQRALVHEWLTAWADAAKQGAGAEIAEAEAIILCDRAIDREVSSARTVVELDGLLGNHPRISGQKLTLALDEFSERLFGYLRTGAPKYRAFRARLREILDAERRRLRVDELKPKILSSFVRNRLIDEVYLPLIGKNFAKQLGTAGDTKRTDRMGLLLVISPPGYGKTTLIEYVAARLGLVFVKVNGPALGHEVTSLDPEDAPNLAARQEVERINLAFEMGNNVLLYLDDIQHTSPELLQKFISLCDGQRKVEGVWKGRSRTWDLRGKKFAVVMAGNPYTESGERFRIPDMLANRADTYNLGEILGGREELFALSYVENALTSNPVTAPLAGRDPKDTWKLIRMAQGEQIPLTDLSYAWSAVEVQEITAVLQRLFKVQQTLLKVNQAYIASASQDDRFRTEPPFKLQGSYRNMAKIADKVVSAMTDEELDRVIDDHYAGEAQTLTTGAEQNLLKLAELRGKLTPEQRARWEEIKRSWARLQLLGGREDDPVARVTGGLSALEQQLGRIRDAVSQASAALGETPFARAPDVAPSSVALTALGMKLDALHAALLELAKAAAQPARAQEAPRAEGPAAPDLTPYLMRLEEVLRAIAERPTSLSAEVLQEAVRRAPAPDARPDPAAYDRQVELVQRALAPLARMARRSLKEEGGGSLRAIQVWQHVNEALQLLQAIPPPAEPAR
ncbi:MAG: DNA repair ATPase [Myxococcaceae bacterium]|nr:DNA repair ATPase [Myxococcaceae bacterium]